LAERFPERRTHLFATGQVSKAYLSELYVPGDVLVAQNEGIPHYYFLKDYKEQPGAGVTLNV